MSPIWQVVGITSAALTLFSLGQLWRRSYFFSYPIFSIFLLAELLVNVAQWAQILSVYSLSSSAYKNLYWSTEFTLQLLILLTMISFQHRALHQNGGTARVLTLASGVLMVACVATVYSVGPPTLSGGRWPGALTRNLSFGSALLNLFLWQSLLRHRRMDVQLMLLSLGAGFWTTGRAIGHSLRLLRVGTGGDVIVVVTELLCLLVWCWALSRFSMPVAKQLPTTPA